eukprot:g61834.t1
MCMPGKHELRVGRKGGLCSISCFELNTKTLPPVQHSLPLSAQIVQVLFGLAVKFPSQLTPWLEHVLAANGKSKDLEWITRLIHISK